MLKKIICLAAGFLATLPAMTSPMVQAASDGLLISEIKLGGGSEPKEFVELYNDSEEDVDLGRYRLEYAKAGFAAQYCSRGDWKAYASPSSLVSVKSLSGLLPEGGFTVIDFSLTDNLAGSLRLTRQNGELYDTVDQVGWGEVAPCPLGNAALLPAAGAAIQRRFGRDGHPLAFSGNNSTDFWLNTAPNPGSYECLPGDCQSDETPPEEPEVPASDPVYHALHITELLPDPAVPQIDAEDEFIELYNPHAFAANVEGYVLHTGSASSSYHFTLPAYMLQPGEYKAWYASETNLTLVNSSGYAWLTAPDGSVLNESDWYQAMPAGTSWSLIGTDWQVSTAATPAAGNQASPTASTTDPDETDTELEACPEGKFRNPETNRCKTLEVLEAALTPCSVGQERNPATNRCRNIVTASAGLTPCGTGQVRNPTTNRCRNVAGASTTLAACQEGYERNPDTNRCRKMATIKATGSDTKTPAGNRAPFNLLLIAAVSVLVLGYAGYEYRHDLVNLWHRLLSRFSRQKG